MRTDVAIGRLLAGTAIGLMMAVTPAAAQQPTLSDDFLDRMVGRWTLAGTIGDRPTIHDVDAEWTLNHQYVKLHEVSRERDDAGRPQYEATVFIGWHEARKSYVCLWIDVFGGGFAGTGFAERQSNELPFVFTAAESSFHTTFRFDPAADSWQLHMDSEAGGKRRPFARLRLTRAARATTARP